MERDSEAFTGLEAAIVLIAFVVVASVFSFAVLGAGFFTTQKTEETLHSAVSAAGSTPELLGNVYGLKRDGGIGSVRYSLGISAGGKLIPFENMVITWSTKDIVKNYEQNDPLIDTTIDAGHWGVVDIKPDTAAGDTFLEPREVFTILINLTEGEELLEGESFSLEMKSPGSNILIISRKAPYQIDNVNVLY
ncbi:flagellin [Methanoplanus sp. FWC-SCC4]|uniref:Flagellin n=1 Tax=Methanochimaera problematica TaxID=2609417 RepID=A0AA97FE95_9EURY|nr:flagellin [Methanoplanus sp. FWC-SCC4]